MSITLATLSGQVTNFFFTPLNLKLASNDIILPSWETRLVTLTFKPILMKG